MAGNVTVPAIVLRQFPIANGRKMVVLLTDRYGKISAGMWVQTKGGRTKAENTPPFSEIRARILPRRSSYDLLHADIEKTHYALGEDVEKYLFASYALELTDRVVSENVPVPEVFRLLQSYLDLLTERKEKHLTLLIAYEIRLLDEMGVRADLSRCMCCGKTEDLNWFSVPEGGLICDNCARKLTERLHNARSLANERPDGSHYARSLANNRQDGSHYARSLAEKRPDGLLYKVDFGIIKTIEYFMNHNLEKFRNAALNEDTARRIQDIVRQYMAVHLDIRKLKSEGFLEEERMTAERSKHGDYTGKD